MRFAAVGSALPILLLAVRIAGAQPTAATTVTVVDPLGGTVPFAVVTMSSTAPLVANDSGVVRLRMKLADSVRMNVKRIGYGAFEGWVPRRADSTYRVTLPVVAQRVAQVTVTERANTPLARSGFYDRVERVRRGAIVGAFITPEELDQRNQTKVTQMVEGKGVVRAGVVTTATGRYAVILGRGGCAMNIVVDGHEVKGSAQEIVRPDVPQSMRGGGGVYVQPSALHSVMSIDDIVDLRSVMAIEVYPSGSNAPAELIPFTGRGSCGVVAIWTGARQ